jgi:hypothetical protein
MTLEGKNQTPAIPRHRRDIHIEKADEHRESDPAKTGNRHHRTFDVSNHVARMMPNR